MGTGTGRAAGVAAGLRKAGRTCGNGGATGVKQVKFVVDYGMVSHGLAPLYVDGYPTELEFWGFNQDIMRRLKRLNELYDRQINGTSATSATGSAARQTDQRACPSFTASCRCRWDSGSGADAVSGIGALLLRVCAWGTLIRLATFSPQGRGVMRVSA